MRIIGLILLAPCVYVLGVFITSFLITIARNGRKFRSIDYKGIYFVAGLFTLAVYGIIFLFS